MDRNKNNERKRFVIFHFDLFVLLCHRGHAKPNETVLIHGASGGVSSYEELNMFT